MIDKKRGRWGFIKFRKKGERVTEKSNERGRNSFLGKGRFEKT